MTKLSPSDFRDHADWIAYVRRCFPENEQAYTLANGRTELFTRLYRARKQSFPSDFEQERKRIEMLTDPTRATALGQLNEKDFCGPDTSDVHSGSRRSAREFLSRGANAASGGRGVGATSSPEEPPLCALEGAEGLRRVWSHRAEQCGVCVRDGRFR